MTSVWERMVEEYESLPPVDWPAELAAAAVRGDVGWLQCYARSLEIQHEPLGISEELADLERRLLGDE